jgi:hypothetical protein
MAEKKPIKSGPHVRPLMRGAIESKRKNDAPLGNTPSSVVAVGAVSDPRVLRDARAKDLKLCAVVDVGYRHAYRKYVLARASSSSSHQDGRKGRA